jgi:capsular polysaccharide biosynthesis protein
METQKNSYAFDDEIDLFELLQKILKRWKAITGITVAFTVLATMIAFTLPKQYMAQATYEIFTTTTTLIDPSMIKEYIDRLTKYKKNIYDFDVTITPKVDKRYITIEVYGKSRDEAISNLKTITDNIIVNGFKDKIDKEKINLKTRLQSIDEILSLYKNGKYIILEPTAISNLLYEKNIIMEWLQNPYILKQVSTIEAPEKPVKPKKMLIIAVAFISGLFMSLFIVLFIDAYNSWKNGKNKI